MSRKASIERKTRETDIKLDLDLDGSGSYDVDTANCSVATQPAAPSAGAGLGFVLFTTGEIRIRVAHRHRTGEEVPLPRGTPQATQLTGLDPRLDPLCDHACTQLAPSCCCTRKV